MCAAEFPLRRSERGFLPRLERPVPGKFTFRVTEASARHLRPFVSGRIGALICGRRVFDQTGGWGGTHPA